MSFRKYFNQLSALEYVNLAAIVADNVVGSEMIEGADKRLTLHSEHRIHIALATLEHYVASARLRQGENPECYSLFERAGGERHDSVDIHLRLQREHVEIVEEEYAVGCKNLKKIRLGDSDYPRRTFGDGRKRRECAPTEKEFWRDGVGSGQCLSGSEFAVGAYYFRGYFSCDYR